MWSFLCSTIVTVYIFIIKITINNITTATWKLDPPSKLYFTAAVKLSFFLRGKKDKYDTQGLYDMESKKYLGRIQMEAFFTFFQFKVGTF